MTVPVGPKSVGRRARLRTIAAVALLSLAACASLPPPVTLPESHALADPLATPLGRQMRQEAPARLRSGFHNLLTGEDALAARIALADQARRTLDLQYYTIHDDASARLVIDHLVAAARRGVRVRVLVDDMNTVGTDAALRRLMAEPGIEVRLYNPFPAARASSVTRILVTLRDFDRVNRRMHNKLFAADNAVAIIGGRNIGDEYFVHSKTSNFVDLDLVVGGAAVRSLSASFDRFWSHRLAYPAAMFVAPITPAASDAALDQAADDAAAAVEAQAAGPTAPAASTKAEEPVPIDSSSEFAGAVAAARWPLTWAPARVFADLPEKMDDDDDPAPDETLADDMQTLLRSARREVILITPYFVPGPKSMALFQELRARGVAIEVLTNSLASTDAPAVHVGYARYREDMLRLGAELYELQPDSPDERKHLGSFRSAESKLHAKAIVVDRKVSLVGTMNFDPRSENLNTEVGVLVASAAVSQELVAAYESLARDSSYRLSLDDDGRLHWTDRDARVLDDEPGASLWLKMVVRLLSPWTPEDWL